MTSTDNNPAVIAARAAMENAARAAALMEEAYRAAGRALREAQAVSDAANDAYFDAVEIATNPGEGAFVVLCDEPSYNRPGILALHRNDGREACIYDTVEEAQTKAASMQDHHDNTDNGGRERVVYTAMTVRAFRARIARSAYETVNEAALTRGLVARAVKGGAA